MDILLFILLLLYIFYLHSQIRFVKKHVVITTTDPTPNIKKEETIPHIERKEVETYTITNDHDKDHVLEFIQWCIKDWSLKLGALFVLLSLSWFVRYAFLHNWIGPYGRISLGIATGLMFLAYGVIRMKKSSVQGIVLMTLGSTSTMMVLLAARIMYDMFTPLYTGLFSIIIVSVITWVSYVHKNTLLSIVGMLLGAVVPLITRGTPDIINLFYYLSALSIGMGTYVIARKSNIVFLLLQITNIIYSLSYFFLGISISSKSTMMIIAILLSSIMFGIHIKTLVDTKRTLIFDVFHSLANTVFTFIWLSILVKDELQGFAIAIVGVVCILVAYTILTYNKIKNASILYTIAGLLLFGIATAYELNGSILTTAFILEIATITFGISISTRKHFIAQATYIGLMTFIVVPLSDSAITSYSWDTGIWHRDSAVLGLIILSLASVGIYYSHTKRITEGARTALSKIIIYAASAYTLILSWLMIHTLTSTTMIGDMISLILYTVISLGVYYYGQVIRKNSLIYGSYVLMVLVILHLLIVDIWNMEIAGRITTFMSIGILLMSTMFIKKINK